MKICTLFLFFIFFFTFNSPAQSNKTVYKPFKVTTAIGYANGSTALGVGISFSAEPAYSINNRITTGIRFETASIRLLYEGDQFISSDLGSIIVTVNYYLSERKLKWFVGGGAGLYALVIDERVGNDVENKFGIKGRAGFDFRHWRLALEANVSGRSRYNAANEYASLKIGINIGGGRKK